MTQYGFVYPKFKGRSRIYITGKKEKSYTRLFEENQAIDRKESDTSHRKVIYTLTERGLIVALSSYLSDRTIFADHKPSNDESFINYFLNSNSIFSGKRIGEEIDLIASLNTKLFPAVLGKWQYLREAEVLDLAKAILLLVASDQPVIHPDDEKLGCESFTFFIVLQIIEDFVCLPIRTKNMFYIMNRIENKYNRFYSSVENEIRDNATNKFRWINAMARNPDFRYWLEQYLDFKTHDLEALKGLIKDESGVHH